MKMYNYRYTFE